MRFEGTAAYVADKDLMVAVNAAIALERPLLVKGEPVATKRACIRNGNIGSCHWRWTDQRPILGATVCASRQENIFPGALTILRELSLGRPVGFLIRRPPTL